MAAACWGGCGGDWFVKGRRLGTALKCDNLCHMHTYRIWRRCAAPLDHGTRYIMFGRTFKFSTHPGAPIHTQPDRAMQRGQRHTLNHGKLHRLPCWSQPERPGVSNVDERAACRSAASAHCFWRTLWVNFTLFRPFDTERMSLWVFTIFNEMNRQICHTMTLSWGVCDFGNIGSWSLLWANRHFAVPKIRERQCWTLKKIRRPSAAGSNFFDQLVKFSSVFRTNAVARGVQIVIVAGNLATRRPVSGTK